MLCAEKADQIRISFYGFGWPYFGCPRFYSIETEITIFLACWTKLTSAINKIFIDNKIKLVAIEKCTIEDIMKIYWDWNYFGWITFNYTDSDKVLVGKINNISLKYWSINQKDCFNKSSFSESTSCWELVCILTD